MYSKLNIIFPLQIYYTYFICNTPILVADNYGVSTYAIFLFSLTIWWAQHWGDATACPYLCFEDCINGSMTFLETAVRTIAATIGGVAVFGYVYLYSIILNHSRFSLLYLMEYLIMILFCLCLNGKLYPNFVEPRSCRNSCWSCSFGSLGQMQRRSCNSNTSWMHC